MSDEIKMVPWSPEEQLWGAVQKKLNEPFPPHEVEWRVQSSGFNGDRPWIMVLAYINNRAIEYRLDQVVGIGNWENKPIELNQGGFLCGLGLRLNTMSEYVWKWDGADKTAVEPIKGGISSAMKRAAQQWGIGRYLYYLDAGFANCWTKDAGPKTENSCFVKKDKNDKYGIKCYWETPILPAFALPTVKGAKIETDK